MLRNLLRGTAPHLAYGLVTAMAYDAFTGR
jgi:hypothetical protein